MTAVYKKTKGFSLLIEGVKLDIELIVDKRKLPEGTVGYIGDLTDDQALKIIRIGLDALDTGSLASFQMLDAADIAGKIEEFLSVLRTENGVDPIYAARRLAEYGAQLAAIKQ